MQFSKNFFYNKTLPLNSKEKRFFEGGLRLSENFNKKCPTFSIITVVLNGEKYLEETKINNEVQYSS